MSAILGREILEVLREISSKLVVVIARLEALEGRVVGVEEPEPEDIEAYYEAEKEFREGRLIRFKGEWVPRASD